MPGFLTNGLPIETVLSGIEQLNIDTMLPQGEDPASAALTTLQMALFAKLAAAPLDKTTVAGSRYYTGVSVGTTVQVHGITALVGSTGGTDKWLAELHDAEGNLLATSATAGATVGSAGTAQQFAFTSPLVIQPGQYFLAIQSNGTTAKLATWETAGLALLTGSATGTFGTGAAITPPTTYTQNVGPMAALF